MMKKVLINGLLAASLLKAFPAVAVNCQRGEEIDLRKVNSRAFYNIPIRNQGDFGICYAHAAATMIDFYRMLYKTDKHNVMSTDPMAAAIHSTALLGESDVEGGKICDVVNSLSQYGYGCSFSQVSVSSVKEFGLNVHRNLFKVFEPYILRTKTFEAVDVKYFNVKERKKAKKLLSEEQRAYLSRMDEFFKWFDTELVLQKINPNALPKKEILFIQLQNVQLENRWAYLQGEMSYYLIQSTCQHYQFSMPKIACNEYENSGGYDLFEIIQENLKKGLPTGASICSQFLAKKSYKGIKYGVHAPDCGEHAVVIIGRRENAGTCEYLIRNSWGDNYRYDWTSSSGDVWVTGDALDKNIFAVQVVR